jgi:hypothetical protein
MLEAELARRRNCGPTTSSRRSHIFDAVHALYATGQPVDP